MSSMTAHDMNGRRQSGRQAARLVSVLLLAAMLGSACSRMPPGGEATLGSGGAVDPATGLVGEGGIPLDGGFGSDGAGAPGAAGNLTGEEVGGDAVGAGTGAGDGPGDAGQPGDGGQPGGDAGQPGGSGQPAGSGQGNQPAGRSGPGIDGRTIKIVFHAFYNDCPAQATEPTDGERTKGKRVTNEYVKFFNEFVLKEHNWTLKAEIVDDGGYFCPERQRATALKIAKEIKPFAALGNSASAQGPIVADVVTRAGIIHAGINWQTTAAERARHPYGWNLFFHPDKSMRFAVDWMARRIKGTTVPNRSVPNEPQVKRVYGILGLDEQGGRELAKTTNDAMVAAGLPVKGVYFTSPSAGVAAQQAAATVAKMRDDGVNTLVWGLDFAPGSSGKDFYVPFTNAMDQQNYRPDVIIGTGGTFLESLANPRVWENAKGTSGYLPITLRTAVNANGPVEEYNNINENSSAFIEAWKEKLGNNDEPYDQAFPGAFDTWAQLSILATGIIHAGPVLNAQTWARGVQSAGSPGSPNRCTIARFMGRDYKHAPSYEWNDEHDGGLEGYTPVYWVNKPTPLGTVGYHESYDNYLYFQDGKQIPVKPTRDTGKQGTDIKKQERIGIKAWKSCKEFPNFPRG